MGEGEAGGQRQVGEGTGRQIAPVYFLVPLGTDILCAFSCSLPWLFISPCLLRCRIPGGLLISVG